MVIDYTFVKTSGEFSLPVEVPLQQDRFSVCLLVLDRDNHFMMALPGDGQGVSDYYVQGVLDFIRRLSIGNLELSGDNETTVQRVIQEVQKHRN